MPNTIFLIQLHKVNNDGNAVVIPFVEFYANEKNANQFIQHEMSESVKSTEKLEALANTYIGKLLNQTDGICGFMLSLKKDYELYIGIPDTVDLNITDNHYCENISTS